MALPLTDANYTRFRELILLRTGLDFPPARRDDLASGLERALETLGNTYYSRILDALYAALVADDPPTWDAVIDALTVCETHFSRTTPQFETLREHVLAPLIAARRKQRNLVLRLWSAGCASGEEAYTLAILVREILPDWTDWRLDILGTDINQRALALARRGVYSDWSFREDRAQEWRAAYFRQVGTQYHLREDVRAMVYFERRNLIADAPGSQGEPAYFDLILCRNVTLYFGPEIRRIVYRRLYDALAPGGWLAVGHADPPPPEFAPFVSQTFPGVTLYRRPTGQAVPTSQPAPVASELPAPQPPPRVEQEAEIHYRQGQWYADRQQWAQALFHCQRAVELNPAHSEAHYTMALIYQNLDAPDRAMEALRRTIYLARTWALPHFTLAGLYRQAGQHAEARRELRSVIALTANLPPDTPIPGTDGLTAARLRAAAERQLQQQP